MQKEGVRRKGRMECGGRGRGEVIPVKAGSEEASVYSALVQNDGILLVVASVCHYTNYSVDTSWQLSEREEGVTFQH